MPPVRDKRLVTVQEAARYLECSEGTVRNKILRGEIEIVEKGKAGRPHKLSFEDVKILAMRKAHRMMPMRFRHVSLLGDPAISNMVGFALNLNGMRPDVCSTVLEAVSAGHAEDRPILVVCGVLLPQEENLLNTYLDEVDVIRCDDAYALRPMVEQTWSKVLQRISSSKARW